MKWKDKIDVLVVSTKHTNKMKNIKVCNVTKEKLLSVIDYNNGKSSIDLLNQMSKPSKESKHIVQKLKRPTLLLP